MDVAEKASQILTISSISQQKISPLVWETVVLHMSRFLQQSMTSRLYEDEFDLSSQDGCVEIRMIDHTVLYA